MLLELRTMVYHAPDIEKAKAWYAALLGIEPYCDEKFYVGFRVGNAELGLDPDTKDTPGGNAGSVAFWTVESVDATLARLAELGATPRTNVQDMGDLRLATVLDPFDNILGIIEFS